MRDEVKEKQSLIFIPHPSALIPYLSSLLLAILTFFGNKREPGLVL
jgi:hypothetical protein